MIRGYIWMIRRFGVRRTWRYEKQRRIRQKEFGRFDPKIHGESLLRAIGATEDQIIKAKEAGLA